MNKGGKPALCIPRPCSTLDTVLRRVTTYNLAFSIVDSIFSVHVTRAAARGVAEAAEFALENPPVADRNEDRLLDGFSYVLDRGWSIRKAALKAQVGYTALYK
jgi:hypothetical protein